MGIIKKLINEILEIPITIKKANARLKHINSITNWPDKVISNQMGDERGTPVDRYYIEKFLDQNKHLITGHVMEIGNNEYTKKYGINVLESLVLTADSEAKGEEYIIGDLQLWGDGRENFVDCFILTQTLPFIYDVFNAAKNIVKILRPGGSALITASGISMISKYDDERWGHYWGFTETSLKALFAGLVPENSIQITAMGNPKTASAFLYGLSVEDMQLMDFRHSDELVPVMLGVVITKENKELS